MKGREDSKKYTESLGSPVPSGCVSIFITLSAWYAHKFKAVHIVYLNAAPQNQKAALKVLGNNLCLPLGSLFLGAAWHPLSVRATFEMGTYKWLTYARHVKLKLQLMWHMRGSIEEGSIVGLMAHTLSYV